MQCYITLLSVTLVVYMELTLENYNISKQMCDVFTFSYCLFFVIMFNMFSLVLPFNHIQTPAEEIIKDV